MSESINKKKQEIFLHTRNYPLQFQVLLNELIGLYEKEIEKLKKEKVNA